MDDTQAYAGIGVYCRVGSLSVGDLFWEPQVYGICRVEAQKPTKTVAWSFDESQWITAPNRSKVYHKASGIGVAR